MDFNMEKTFDGSRWRVELHGEIDIYNSTDLKTQLSEMMDEHSADVHLDCTGLEYIDSTGLGALVGALKNIKSKGQEMHLSNIKSNILKLFKITSLDKVFILEGVDNNE